MSLGVVTLSIQRPIPNNENFEHILGSLDILMQMRIIINGISQIFLLDIFSSLLAD
jgi:hypothetical protein